MANEIVCIDILRASPSLDVLFGGNIDVFEAATEIDLLEFDVSVSEYEASVEITVVQ